MQRTPNARRMTSAAHVLRVAAALAAMLLSGSARTLAALQPPRATQDTSAGESAQDASALLTGTLLLPDGRGAAGVVIELGGWSMLPARATPSTPFEPWRSP